MDNLVSLRHELRLRRQKLTPSQRRTASLFATQHALQFIHTHQPDTIGIFLSLPEEIDTQPLIDTLWQENYVLYLPVVTKKNAPLIWRPYNTDTILSQDKVGIWAPIYQPIDLTIDFCPGLVIMPLVGYDHNGYRIGKGGGYYDRTFTHKRRTQYPLLLGFAYVCQQVPKINPRPWDVPMDALANELNLLCF